MTTIFASGLIEKSFRTINYNFGKETEKSLRSILKANKKDTQFQELNTFLVLMSQTNKSIPIESVLEVEKNRFFKLFQNYNDINIQKYLTKHLKNDKELKETSEIVLDYLTEIDSGYKKIFNKKISKVYKDLPEMLNEISIRSFLVLWDQQEDNKYRFYLNGFDQPDKMLFEFSRDTFQNFDLLQHFDEFIILNFFLAFMERTILKLTDLTTVLEKLEIILPKSLVQTSDKRLQTKVSLFFRILTAKLSALQELDNLTLRILSLFEGSKNVLQPLNLVSINSISLNNIMDLIENDVKKGTSLLHNIAEKIVTCQTYLRDYSEHNQDIQIITTTKDFNSQMKDLADLSVDLFIEAEILKFWGDFFGQDIPNFNFNTDIFSLKDETKLKSSENAIITVDGLFKNYQLGTTTVYALRGINLEILKGEFIIIYGSSGSGKTTLLNCMASLDAPDRGIVLFKGKNIHKMTDPNKSKARLNEMGFIFQNYALLPHYNTRENVTLPADLSGMSKKLKDRITDLLNGVEINLQSKQFPAQLSGGQMQRVSIARALTNHPSVIFADEPTGDLDSVTGKKVMDLLEHFHKETDTTVVVITHDESLLRYATRVITIKDGLIIADNKN